MKGGTGLEDIKVEVEKLGNERLFTTDRQLQVALKGSCESLWINADLTVFPADMSNAMVVLSTVEYNQKS
jgi:hypothetical protein